MPHIVDNPTPEELRRWAKGYEDFGYCLCEVGNDNNLCWNCQKVIDLREEANRVESSRV